MGHRYILCITKFYWILPFHCTSLHCTFPPHILSHSEIKGGRIRQSHRDVQAEGTHGLLNPRRLYVESYQSKLLRLGKRKGGAKIDHFQGTQFHPIEYIRSPNSIGTKT